MLAVVNAQNFNRCVKVLQMMKITTPQQTSYGVCQMGSSKEPFLQTCSIHCLQEPRKLLVVTFTCDHKHTPGCASMHSCWKQEQAVSVANSICCCLKQLQHTLKARALAIAFCLAPLTDFRW